jgi:hypothetical protein
MNCDSALPLVEKLFDGEASPFEKREAEAHVAGCTSCREHLDFLASLADAASRALPEPPDSYWEELPRKILRRAGARRRQGSQSFWRRFFAPPVLRWAAAAATLVVLAAVGTSVLLDDPGVVTGEAPRPASAPAPTASMEPEESREREPDAPAPPMARDEPAPPPERPAETLREEAVTGEDVKALTSLGYVGPAAQEPAEPPPAPAARRSDEASVLSDEAGKESRPEGSREEEALPVMQESAPAPASARAMAERANFSARARSEDECERWRRLLSTSGGEGERTLDARFELARCSLLRFEREGGEALREAAVADAEAFLEREADGERAEEIRESLARVRRKP